MSTTRVERIVRSFGGELENTGGGCMVGVIYAGDRVLGLTEDDFEGEGLCLCLYSRWAWESAETQDDCWTGLRSSEAIAKIRDLLAFPVGERVKCVRLATADECEEQGFDPSCRWGPPVVVIEFESGSLLFPSQDDEGNGPGTFFATEVKGEKRTTLTLLP